MALQQAQKIHQEYWVHILIYAALLTPFIVGTRYAIFPFVFPKVIYFELIVGLLAALAVPVVIRYSQHRIKNIFTYVLGAYGAVLILSASFAFDQTRAFWGNFERMTGVIYILFTIIFSLIVAAYYSGASKQIKNFLQFAVGVSVIISLIGLYQRLNEGFLLSQSERIAGTFGNPIYLGGFAAQFALIAGYLAYIYRGKMGMWLYCTAAGINLLAVYYSGTRSALMGLVIALGIIGVSVSQRLWVVGYKKQIAALWFGVLLVIASIFALPRFFPNVLSQSSFLTRFTDISSAVSGTGSTRLIAWEIAIKGFKERPIIGWGPENFYYVFNKHYNPRSLTFGQYETWFDHAHNAVFDVLVTQGLIGIILYLAQYGVIFWMCYKTRSENKDENLLSLVLMSVFVLHFVHNLFVFDHPGSYVEFYAFAGIVAARYLAWHHEYMPESNSTQLLSTMSVGTARVISGGVLLVTAYVIIPSVQQNYLDFKAQNVASLRLDQAEEYFKKAIAVNGPYTADVLLDSARVAQRIPTVVNGSTPFLAVPQFKKYFEFSINNLERLLTEVEPGSEIGAIMQGQLLLSAAQLGDKEAAKKADRAFERAAQLSPKRQQVAFTWARLKVIMNDHEGAKKLLTEAIANEPTVATGHWYLAILLIGNDTQGALRELKFASQYGYDITSASARIISAVIFGQAGEYREAADMFEQAVADSTSGPWDKETAQLAERAFTQTQRSEALSTLRTRFPELLQLRKK